MILILVGKNYNHLQKSEISLYREDIEYIWTESVVKNNIKNNKRFRALFGKILKPIFNIENEQIEDTIQSLHS